VIYLALIPLALSFGPIRVLALGIQLVFSLVVTIFVMVDYLKIREVSLWFWLATFMVILTALITTESRHLMAKHLRESEALIAESRKNFIAARHDPLTGLLNRRGLLAFARERSDEDLSLVFIDCDEFKSINDTYGHQVGDEYLQALAKRIVNGVKKSDLVARWGGDEFLLLLHVDVETSTTIFERINLDLEVNPILTSRGPVFGSLSAGIATWKIGENVETAIAFAASSLHAAKTGGNPSTMPPTPLTGMTPRMDIVDDRSWLIFSRLKEAVLVEDSQRRVKFANQALFDIFTPKISPEMLIGYDVAQFDAGTAALFVNSDAWLRRTREIVALGDDVYGEEWELRDGRWFARDFAVRMSGGKVFERIWITRDSTALRENQ